MTDINWTTDRPASINTVEKTIVWLVTLLETLYRGQSYKEARGNSIDSGLAPIVDYSIVAAADGTKRFIARVSIELDPNYTNDKSKKFWQFAQDIGTGLIPPAFKAD